MLRTLILALFCVALTAHAQTPADFGYTWEPVGTSYEIADGRTEVKIEVTITMLGEPVTSRTYPVRWQPDSPDSAALCEQMATDYYSAYMVDRVVELDQYAQQTGQILQGEMYDMWRRMIERVKVLDIPDWADMDEAEQTTAIVMVETIWQEEAETLTYVKPAELGDYVAELTGQGFTSRYEMWAFILMVREWI